MRRAPSLLRQERKNQDEAEALNVGWLSPDLSEIVTTAKG